MKERPILFSGPMVRALLAGKKTQTRRVLNAPDSVSSFKNFHEDLWDRMQGNVRGDTVRCPYGQPGDRLWVRESFAEGIHQMADVNHWAYAADPFGNQQRLGDRWKPSIHMPRAASRITLEVTGIRVERLQDISEADALAEGVDMNEYIDMPYSPSMPHVTVTMKPRTGREAYAALWESINGPESWAANPWVWVVEFKRLRNEA